jgi:hypothetical protein
MTSTTTQYTENKTFFLSSYNGFSILIGDKDGFINATKLVNDINNKESITKELRNITRSSDFITLENFRATNYIIKYQINSITKLEEYTFIRS